MNSINNLRVTENKQQTLQEQLSSGKRINRAKDDPAGMAIAAKLMANAKGLEVATRNAGDWLSALNTAESGLITMTDDLNRIRELSLQAANGVYTDEQRDMMQQEVDQMLDGIKQSADRTEFNTFKLLDGNFVDKHAAVNPDGSGMKISIENSTLETLGLSGYNLASLDLDAIDAALDKVNEARAKIGAQYNRLEHTINSNDIAYINQMAAKSRVEDTDYAKAMIEKKTEEAKEQYSIFALKKENENKGKMMQLLM